MTHILVFGDSITAGCWDSRGGWVSRIFQKLHARNARGKDYVLVYNLGISGGTSQTIWKQIQHELIPRLDPDASAKNIVIISGGANDTLYSRKKKKHWVELPAYKKNMQRIIAFARKYTPHVIVTGLEPCDQSKVDPLVWEPSVSYLDKHLERYNEALKRICQEENVPFLNFYGKLNHSNYISKLPDGTHPLDKGHAMMEKIVWEALKRKKWV